VLFGWAINALNGEKDFDPRAVASRRLVTMPDGSKVIETYKPYWLQLRDSTHTFALALALNSKQRQLRDPHDRVALAEAFKTAQPAFPLSTDATYRKAQDEFVRTLRELMGRWHQSNWSLAACFQANPDVRAKVEKLLRRQPLELLAASNQAPSILINPFAASGLFGVKRHRRGKNGPLVEAQEDATTLFIRLVQHPECSRIGKCARCNRYFFGRPGQKCCPRPRRCGSYLAAIRATKANWRKKRKGLIVRAQEAIAQWELGGAKTPWKFWVAKRVRKTEKWVTRAINRGELKPPPILEETNSCGKPLKKGKHSAN
jgi:hypothetical protein